MRNQRYILLGFFCVATFFGFAVRGLVVPLLARMEVVDPRFGPMSGTALLGILVAGVIFLMMNRHQLVYSFSDESVSELRKVVWPGKDETVRSATVVVATTLFQT